MINLPKISVIIPVYNGEKTITETVESVLKQTFSDFELIVIDDGSQDSTLDILVQFQDSRLKVFSYPNAGVSASRNRGIELARGKYIAFLDADDLWTPEKLESQVNALEANPQAVLAYSLTDFVDETGQPLGYGVHHSVSGDVYPALLEHNIIGSGSNALIHKQVLIEKGGFDESLTHGEDWDLWLQLAACYHFVAVPSSQILYRVTDTSASTDIFKQEKGSSIVIERAFAQAPESLQYLKRCAYARLYMYLASRALRGLPQRRKGLIAARFMWRAVKGDPSYLRQIRYMLTLLFKIATAVLLPSRQAQVFRSKVKSLTHL